MAAGPATVEDKVKVAVRVRPLLGAEAGSDAAWQVKGSSIEGAGRGGRFEFGACLAAGWAALRLICMGSLRCVCRARV